MRLKIDAGEKRVNVYRELCGQWVLAYTVALKKVGKHKIKLDTSEALFPLLYGMIDPKRKEYKVRVIGVDEFIWIGQIPKVKFCKVLILAVKYRIGESDEFLNSEIDKSRFLWMKDEEKNRV